MKCYECGKPASVIMDCGTGGFLHVALCRKCIDKALKGSQERLDARVMDQLKKMGT